MHLHSSAVLFLALALVSFVWLSLLLTTATLPSQSSVAHLDRRSLSALSLCRIQQHAVTRACLKTTAQKGEGGHTGDPGVSAAKATDLAPV